MGIARLLLVGLAVLVLLALIVVGVLSLIGSLKSDETTPAPSGAGGFGQVVTDVSSPASPVVSVSRGSPGADVPTLFVECQADRCPLFVRVTGGDVVEDRDLSRGQQASYFQPALDVVIGDASTVHVEVNGEPRSAGKPGERQSFTAERAPAS
ncbi:hypothetical protein [Sphaerisporangium perillae]|uniref:hypothetical protein n=1 Tax=Sphaerisporangium perillae TaxID=2935860 RepID=UPI00200C4C6C|nr:hypothetical protein [Sphaerisporangium perillae]